MKHGSTKLETLTTHGMWKTPNNETPLIGDLTIDRNSITLLISEVRKDHIWDRKIDDYFPVLLGETFEGRITLIDCNLTSANQIRSGLTRYNFVCEQAYLGGHIDKPELAACTKGYIEFPVLDIWLRKRAYTSSSRFEEEQATDFSLHFDTFNEYYSWQSEGYSAKFTCVNRPEFLTKDFTLRSHFRLEITAPEPVGINSMLQEIESYTFLLTILYGRSIQPSHLSLDVQGDQRVIKLPPFFEQGKRDVQTIAIPLEYPADSFQQQVGAAKHCFSTYKDIIHSSLLKDNEPADEQEVRSIFLNHCHAIEGIAIRNESAKILAKQDFNQFRELTLDSIQKRCAECEDETQASLWREFEERARETISHMNERRLEAKIRAFFRSFECRLIAAIKLSDELIPRIVSTRNFYAHMSSTKPASVFSYEDMAYFARRLHFLILIYFLKQIGVEEKDAVYSLCSTKQHRSIISFRIYNH